MNGSTHPTPSVDAFLQNAPVASEDLAGEPRWPNLRPLALAAGIRACLSVPVRQRHGPIGALDFPRTDPQPWQPQDLAAANAFARLIVATCSWPRPLSSRRLHLRCGSRRNMTPASNKPASSSCSANGSTRPLRSSCCASRPRSRINQSEPSPNASFPAPDSDLHLPDPAPRSAANGWHRTPVKAGRTRR
jgi:GAF domain